MLGRAICGLPSPPTPHSDEQNPPARRYKQMALKGPIRSRNQRRGTQCQGLGLERKALLALGPCAFWRQGGIKRGAPFGVEPAAIKARTLARKGVMGPFWMVRAVYDTPPTLHG